MICYEAPLNWPGSLFKSAIWVLMERIGREHGSFNILHSHLKSSFLFFVSTPLPGDPGRPGPRRGALCRCPSGGGGGGGQGRLHCSPLLQCPGPLWPLHHPPRSNLPEADARSLISICYMKCSFLPPSSSGCGLFDNCGCCDNGRWRASVDSLVNGKFGTVSARLERGGEGAFEMSRSAFNSIMQLPRSTGCVYTSYSSLYERVKSLTPGHTQGHRSTMIDRADDIKTNATWRLKKAIPRFVQFQSLWRLQTLLGMFQL